MTAAEAELTEDHFLDGRLRILQPRTGYRAATDPVLLAAAVPAKAGESVLDLGCGVGTASYCLAARVEVELTGLEIQADYAALAERNSGRNGIAMTVIRGDVARPPPALRQVSFDHVISNPPYHEPGALPSPDGGRDTAHREALPVAIWLATALARLRPRGWLTLIHRTERLDEILAALDGAGDIAIKPLVARTGRDAKRVLIRARKGARAPLRLCSPLVLHAGAAHTSDGDDFTPETSAILRGRAEIAF